MKSTRRSLLAVLGTLAGGTLVPIDAAHAASAHKISQDADQALRSLYAAQPKARELGSRAKAILVFPKIINGVLGTRRTIRRDDDVVHSVHAIAANLGPHPFRRLHGPQERAPATPPETV